MNKKAIKLFILDYMTLFLVTFFVQVFFFSVLFYIKGIWFKETIYFSCLVFLVLAIYLFIRSYKRIKVYEKFILDSHYLNEYIINEPKGIFEESFNKMMYEIIENKNRDDIQNKQGKKLQKLLVYRFVHQIKTPVSVIKLICDKHSGEEDYKKIERNLSSIQYNLNQMLNIYKLEDFKNDFVAEKIHLATICKDSINGLKDYFIMLQVYPKLFIDEEIYVYSDPKWLKLVLNQLLTNAIKYSNRGQTISIEVKKIEGKIYLSVIDNGIGIPQAEIKKIFELFYVGKNGRNNADSSGIGLYIVKKVIEYLGHDIKATSEIDKGTTITIKF